MAKRITARSRVRSPQERVRPAWVRDESAMLPRRAFHPSRTPTMSDTSRLISVSAAAAVLLALASCQRAAEEQKAATPAPTPWKLDESQLQQPIRFAATDLDPAQNACKDLSA